VVLEKYQQKRNFTSTPEPAGDEKLAAERAKKAQPKEGLFFCVQKHLASHLHYDFRLEHNGVLLSWAVPKGPSLDPAVKRLAMHVEDHPIEYGTFEGVIPEGYGAGIVMLWDVGTWVPQADDIDAALKKGDLKFTLDGYKLKGSWVLVRTGGRWGGRGASGDARSWLLIKHKDDWAGPVDIAEFAPKSVKSEGDFEDILAADNPDVWITNRPAQGGETGAMLAKIIERAAQLKAGKSPSPPRKRSSARGPREDSESSTLREPQGRPEHGRGTSAAARARESLQPPRSAPARSGSAGGGAPARIKRGGAPRASRKADTSAKPASRPRATPASAKKRSPAKR
jgi:bifunctional non-homologous end joining protein LigD